MKLSRQFTVFGSAIFCVVIFSLYLMLDRGHLDYPRGPRQEGSFPQVSTWWRAQAGGPALGLALLPADAQRPGRVRPHPTTSGASSGRGSATLGPLSSQSAGRSAVAA